MRRAERIAALVQELVHNQGALISLSALSKRFQVAKSTISEDIASIRSAMEQIGQGHIETILGSGGGVRYLPLLQGEGMRAHAMRLLQLLSEPNRVLTGGFIYMTDIVFSPEWSYRVGCIFASRFYHRQPNCVVTVETKGIPAAVMTAYCLGVPLVVLRRDSRVTEGFTVSLNYLSGSQQRIQSMSLPRRALPPGARALLIDDFMRGGGTARGMMELLHEVGADVVGMGVLVATAEPKVKKVKTYDPILILESVSEQEKRIELKLGHWLDPDYDPPTP